MEFSLQLTKGSPNQMHPELYRWTEASEPTHPIYAYMVITSFLDRQSNNPDKYSNNNTHKFSNLTGQRVPIYSIW